MTTDIKRLTATGILAFALGSWALPALALASLEGRTVTGDRVDAYATNAVMIYDPNANLTWLRDWDVNGAKPWVDQLIWASNLQMGTFANWSLPTARNQDGSAPCFGYDCTGSQMGYLWYEVLGNTAGPITNAGPFQNLRSTFQNPRSDIYWFGTEYARNPNLALSFYTVDGYQNLVFKDVASYAVAVRPGDVAAPVPEPQTWPILLLGLGALTVAVRRRPG